MFERKFTPTPIAVGAATGVAAGIIPKVTTWPYAPGVALAATYGVGLVGSFNGMNPQVAAGLRCSAATLLAAQIPAAISAKKIQTVLTSASPAIARGAIVSGPFTRQPASAAGTLAPAGPIRRQPASPAGAVAGTNVSPAGGPVKQVASAAG